MNNKFNLERVRFIENERIFLTPLTMDDLDTYYKWDHDLELAYLDRGPWRPKSLDNAREEFEHAFKDKTSVFLSIVGKRDGNVIGCICLMKISDLDRSCHWGIKLDKKHWRQGYGSEAAKLLLKYVFDDLGFRKLRSGTHSGNTASIKFQDKLGFVKEGILRKEFYIKGEYVDSIEYGMLREEYEKKYK